MPNTFLDDAPDMGPLLRLSGESLGAAPVGMPVRKVAGVLVRRTGDLVERLTLCRATTVKP